jgi:hypothetical protein
VYTADVDCGSLVHILKETYMQQIADDVLLTQANKQSKQGSASAYG